MYLFFDTETSGLPNQFLPLSDSNQARVIQLGAILTDANFEEQGSVNLLVRTENVNMSKGAFDAHGITINHTRSYGVSSEAAIQVFLDLADRASKIFAYNVAFDKKLLDIETALLNKSMGQHIHKLKCAMHLCTNICKLPPTKKGTQYKWPKLEEAYKFFFPDSLGFDAHDALADCRATLRIVKHIATNHLAVLD